MNIIGIEVVRGNPGEERRYGIPRSDVERVANHYGISLEEAECWLRIHSVEELLPARGSGLTTAVGAVSPEKLELTYGDTLRITTSFNYRGPARDVTLYGSIGNKGWTGFNEIINAEATHTTPDSPATFVPVTASVDIPITTDIAPKPDYDIYCKLKEHMEAGLPEVDDVIDIVGVPPTFELLEETVYPYAYVYEGERDGGVFTFTADPFSPDSWIAGRLASICEDEVRKAGGKMLEMRTYVDKSPLLWENWRIEIISAPPKTVTGVAMPLGIAWWALAILAALAIILIIIITWAAKEIIGLFKRKPGLDEVKVSWGKETLIMTIQDSEEYWERTPTPIETLEEMSEEDLRHYLNKIAEEEVPPAEPGLGLVIGAVGVLGLGALGMMAMAMGRPEERAR